MPLQEVNLRTVEALATVYALPVRYPDHTEGIHVVLAAIKRGARMIERHFTLSRTLLGPYHKASLPPDDPVDG